MRVDRFTIKTQEALEKAATIATQRGNQEIFPEHLLVAMLEQEEGITPSILKKIGSDPAWLMEKAEAILDAKPQVSGVDSGSMMSRDLKTILDAAWSEAERLHDEYLSTEHLLLAMADKATGQLGSALSTAGVTHAAVLKALEDVRAIIELPTRTRRKSTSRFNVSPATLPKRPAWANSTRSSAGTTRSAASCRSCPAGRKTTRSSLANPAPARPPSSRGWPAG
ncbi:MAG: hypothetical protein LUG50_10075 [Planctomycetaceae bacterium]|nr:hypothetical protein [Planctomycetaceae bacterium]